jgi:hypothetical protein
LTELAVAKGKATLQAMAQFQYSVRDHRDSIFTVEVREGENVTQVRGFRSRYQADAWIADHQQAEREFARSASLKTELALHSSQLS